VFAVVVFVLVFQY